METLKLNAPVNNAARQNNKTIYNNVIPFVNSDAQEKAIWFMVSMFFHGVILMPLPSLLIYFYGAPILVQIIGLGLFFSNIIVGISGYSLRLLISVLAISVSTHLFMLIYFMH